MDSNNNVRLVSLDTSTKKTGWAKFINGEFDSSGLFDFEKIANSEERFSVMSRKILDMLNNERPWIIVIEECVVVRNAAVQRTLLRLQGIVYCWCLLHDCEFNVVRPTEWRAGVGIHRSGKGSEREDLKKISISKVLELYGKEVSDDEAEAILVGLSHVNKFKK